MPEEAAIEVARAVPVKPELAEDLTDLTNALNEELAGVGLWADLIPGPRSVYFVLFRVR